MSVEQLDEALRQPGATPSEVIAVEFDRLGDLAAALPLTTDEYCFAANWIASARECGAAGDVGAARHQLEMARKQLALSQGKPASPRSATSHRSVHPLVHP